VTRARIFSKRFAVPPEAIDIQGHVSNLAYVGWMQDVAIQHSAAVGWPLRRYLELGAGWVVRSHFVEYFRPRSPRSTADSRSSSTRPWLKDKYGVSRQVVPTVLIEMMNDPDQKKSGRAMQAMLQMKKLDIAELTRAFAG
jgi:hypothetical protein